MIGHDTNNRADARPGRNQLPADLETQIEQLQLADIALLLPQSIGPWAVSGRE